jgi:hypothetical protein
MVDPLTGAAFYVKFFKNAEHADTEALASHLYRLLGINAPDARVAGALWFGAKGKGFQRALLSPWESGYEQRVNGSFTSDEKAVLRSQFPADVWMSNYDVVGKGPATKYDNLLVNLGSPVASASIKGPRSTTARRAARRSPPRSGIATPRRRGVASSRRSTRRSSRSSTVRPRRTGPR